MIAAVYARKSTEQKSGKPPWLLPARILDEEDVMTDLGRWDGNVHYYEYTPETVRSLRPERDGLEVATAFIYRSDSDHVAIGIVMAISSRELRAGTKVAEAIATARRILPRLVETHRAEAETATENRSYVYGWDGTPPFGRS